MGEPTSANGAPILRLRPITLSVVSFINGEYSLNKSSSLVSDARRRSAYGGLLAGWDGWPQRYGRQCLQRISTLDSCGLVQRQRSLCFSIRKWADELLVGLTGYHELVLIGVPILFQKSLDVDDDGILSPLRPNGMSGLHLDLCAHLRNRRNVPVHAYHSECACNENMNDILGLDYRPGRTSVTQIRHHLGPH